MAHSRTRELETGKQELVYSNVESLYGYNPTVSSLIKAQYCSLGLIFYSSGFHPLGF